MLGIQACVSHGRAQVRCCKPLATVALNVWGKPSKRPIVPRRTAARRTLVGTESKMEGEIHACKMAS